MSRIRVIVDDRSVKIIRKYFGKAPVNEREMTIFDKNTIIGLFRPTLNGKHRIEYMAPRGKSLEKYIKKDFTIHKLYAVLAQTIEIVKTIENNGLYINNLMLDKKYIFIKETTGELWFLYEPIVNRQGSVNIYSFLADFVNTIKSSNRELENECEKLKSFFLDINNYRIESIENYIRKVYPQIYQQIATVKKKQTQGDSGFIASSRLSYQKHYFEEKSNVDNKNDIFETTILTMPEEGTTLLSGEEEGTVILREIMPSAKLCRLKNKEITEICNNEFHIGKDAACHLCIANNSAISRKHASIYYNDDVYVVKDEKSTNHTYVNGIMLGSEQEHVLNNGDVIRFANEDFEFYID
ncbi:MAG: FHA domain-containing protein [Lachnospiraceae bacterium]|nr:FHA domain-containing protein [Lachnospiraceae bacterium]